MLPDFDDNGNLPPGIHWATIEEVERRFGNGSEEREVEAKELRSFVEWARGAGVRRLLINGSFVTSARSPNDVDVVILPSDKTPAGTRLGELVETVWPFLQVFVALDEADFEEWAEYDFATDRMGNAKGVVELEL